MKEKQALDALGALSNQTRLRIMKYLISCGEQGQSAGAIAQRLGASPSRTSFHLATLERAGLLSSQRVSRQIVYQADFRQMGGLINYLLVDCCQNDATVTTCCDRASPPC